MNLEDRKVWAMVECLLLWDRLAESVVQFKGGAIVDLYDEGLLIKDEYEYDCPLCDELRWGDGNCHNCPWPGIYSGMGVPNCATPSSPYSAWRAQRTKRNARAVLDMLLTVEF